jgi:predicted Zn-dependent peptidase
MLEVAESQSAHYPKEVMARELTRLGARLGSQATADLSSFSLTALRRSFGESMRLFMDALVHPSFTDEEVALRKERRLNALKAQQEDADQWLQRLSLMNTFANHPYAANPLGTEELIRSATAEQLRALHAKTVNRARLVLVVVGDVTREEVEAAVRPAVKDLPAGAYQAPVVPPMPDADRESTKLVARDLPTVYAMGLFPLPNRKSEEYAAAQMGMILLAQRLFEEIRTKRNLSYAPSAGLRNTDAGFGLVYVTTPDPNAAIRVMRDEIAKMRSAPVPENELRDGKRQMKTWLFGDKQTAEEIAGTLAEWEILGGGWENADAFVTKLDELTPEQIRQVMDRYARKLDFVLMGKVEGVDTKLVESF